MKSFRESIDAFNDFNSVQLTPNLSTRCNGGDILDDLELDKLHKKKHEANIKSRRIAAIEGLNDKGFPTSKPRHINKDEYDTRCTPNVRKNDMCDEISKMFMSKWLDKPQNCRPKDLLSQTDGNINPTVNMSKPYSSDRAFRSKYQAAFEGANEARRKHIISNVFPQLQLQDELNDEEAALARKYLYSSEYQASYCDSVKLPTMCRKIFPLSLLQSIPDPVRSVSGMTTAYPPTESWQSSEFDAATFDRNLPRYEGTLESRPYEFSTIAPRIDQLPTYSGCHATADRRVEDDNPYKTYVPLTKVRGTVPSEASKRLQQNIPGYTGCVTDHVKETKPVVS